MGSQISAGEGPGQVVMRIKQGIEPLRFVSVCTLTAALCLRNFAHGQVEIDPDHFFSQPIIFICLTTI